MKNKIILSIDPDLHNSGVAAYNNNELVCVTSLPLWKVFEWLIAWCENSLGKIDKEVIVLLEYPINTNTYHKGGKGAALNVGKNQAIAIVIKEFLDYKKINYKLLKPAGYSNYFKNNNYFMLQTKWHDRTNNDARSAAAMIWINK